MKYWGKLLGFLFGLMLSKNIFGALLGAWIGHRFDKGVGMDFSDLAVDEEDKSQHASFFYSTFSIMGHVAKANGRVTEHEIAFAQAYMDKLRLNRELKQQAQDAFREGKMAGFPVTERLKRFKRTCRSRHDLLLLFLEIQIQVAFADGNLDQAERKVLHHIASVLGFSRQELDKLLEMIIASAAFHQQKHGFAGQRTQSNSSQRENARKVLGVSQDASAQEIKKAYRKLMSQHHPDKLVAKGLPPEMMEIAKQKTQDIQAAYDLLNKI